MGICTHGLVLAKWALYHSNYTFSPRFFSLKYKYFSVFSQSPVEGFQVNDGTIMYNDTHIKCVSGM
jgi:hypothetical protein